MTNTELKSLRLALGLSLREAARRCDVAERSYARWESGERAVPDDSHKRLQAKRK